MPRIAALYTRVATTSQSCEAQKQEVLEIAARRGLVWFVATDWELGNTHTDRVGTAPETVNGRRTTLWAATVSSDAPDAFILGRKT